MAHFLKKIHNAVYSHSLLSVLVFTVCTTKAYYKHYPNSDWFLLYTNLKQIPTMNSIFKLVFSTS